MIFLVIDDDKDTNLLTSLILKKEPRIKKYIVETSPVQALNTLKRGEIKPDCILVDLSMPEMSGFRFIREFEEEAWNQNPRANLYILSSSDDPSDRQKVMEYASVNRFIRKPLTRHILSECIDEH